MPVSWLIRLTASESSSVPSVTAPPRLRLATVAPCAAAHSIPAMIPEVLPKPKSSSTFPLSSVASGATPLYLPPDAAPVPAAMLATWVPCPTRSAVSPESEKFADASIRPARSACGGLSPGAAPVSIPVSRIAILTPLPVSPRCQAAGPPICGTLLSRDARNCRSSVTRWIVPATRSDDVGVSAAQKSATAFLRIEVARAPMLVSTRDLVAPGTTPCRARPRAVAELPAYRMITGRVALAASSRCSATRMVTSNRARSRRPAATSGPAADGITTVCPAVAETTADVDPLPGPGSKTT